VANSAASELERELDRLYALPLSEFTAARDELVGRLRADGRRDDAARAKALRKPTAAVWLVNQLARERELDLQRLLKAGEALSEAQAGAGGGESGDAFAAARREEHGALERLGAAARELAAREGLGAPAVDRATQTLRAASLTAEGRDLLRRGRLTEELEPPGFDALAALGGGAPRRAAKRPAKTAPKAGAGKRRQQLTETRKRLRELRAEERKLAGAARAAQREAERAEAEAGALRARADEAQAEAEQAAAKRAESESELERLG
jgi:hypothetical protein